jgi:hypothetical protein
VAVRLGIVPAFVFVVAGLQYLHPPRLMARVLCENLRDSIVAAQFDAPDEQPHPDRLPTVRRASDRRRRAIAALDVSAARCVRKDASRCDGRCHCKQYQTHDDLLGQHSSFSFCELTWFMCGLVM